MLTTDDHTPWTEKYRTKKLENFKGQTLAIDKVKLFLKSFPKKRGLILHGPPGVGKTSLAYAIASENNFEILELNASDLRDKKKIAAIIAPAVQQRSLFKQGKIVLIDEVDGISGMKDRGGLSELLSIIDKSAYPIIITANDIWNKKFNLLRKKSEVVALKELDYKDTLKILDEISKKEALTISTQIMISIAVKARGDVRAAINDLQVYSQMNDVEVGKIIGERNKEESIFVALKHIFKNKNIDSKMLGIYDEINMPIDEVFLWIEENIPLEYKGEELAKAYDALSLADVFRGRIYRKQHWRFMVYEYFFLGPGIASSKKYNRTDYTQYKKPTRILKIWLANQRFAKKKTICQKYAKHTHISTKGAMKDFLLIKTILQNENIQKTLKLTQDEINYLKE